MLAAAALAARLSARPALALAFVGWNPLLAVHFAGAGTDAWLAPSWWARSQPPPRDAGSLQEPRWALGVLVKWVPLSCCRCACWKRAHDGCVRAMWVRCDRAGDWGHRAREVGGSGGLHAFGPLARNANHETRWALPHRLSNSSAPAMWRSRCSRQPSHWRTRGSPAKRGAVARGSGLRHARYCS
jgi:hypothetical protein